MIHPFNLLLYIELLNTNIFLIILGCKLLLSPQIRVLGKLLPQVVRQLRLCLGIILRFSHLHFLRIIFLFCQHWGYLFLIFFLANQTPLLFDRDLMILQFQLPKLVHKLKQWFKSKLVNRV